MKGSRNGLCNYCITLRLYLLPLSYTLQMVKNDKSSVCLPQCFLKRSTLKNWGVVKWAGEEIGGNPRMERRKKYGRQNQEGWRAASSQPYGQGL